MNSTDGSEAERKLTKEIFKEALKEWLDEKFAEFGRWSLMGLGAAALAGMVALVLYSQGWRHP